MKFPTDPLRGLLKAIDTIRVILASWFVHTVLRKNLGKSLFSDTGKYSWQWHTKKKKKTRKIGEITYQFCSCVNLFKFTFIFSKLSQRLMIGFNWPDYRLHQWKSILAFHKYGTLYFVWLHFILRWHTLHALPINYATNPKPNLNPNLNPIVLWVHVVNYN